MIRCPLIQLLLAALSLLLIPTALHAVTVDFGVGKSEGELDYTVSYDLAGSEIKSHLEFPVKAKIGTFRMSETGRIGQGEIGVSVEASKDLDAKTTAGIDKDWTGDHLDFKSTADNQLRKLLNLEGELNFNYVLGNSKLGLSAGFWKSEHEFAWTAFDQNGFDTFNKSFYNISGDTLNLLYERNSQSPYLGFNFESELWNRFKTKFDFDYMFDVDLEDQDQHLLIKKISWINSSGDGYRLAGNLEIRIFAGLWIKGRAETISYETDGSQVQHFINTDYFDEIPAKADYEATNISSHLIYEF